MKKVYNKIQRPNRKKQLGRDRDLQKESQILPLLSSEIREDSTCMKQEKGTIKKGIFKE